MIACRTNTLRPLFGLTGNMDRLFDRVCGGTDGLIPSVFGSEAGWTPPVDITENDKGITVLIEVPGVEPKDIEVTMSDQVLTIAGEKEESKDSENDGFQHSERRFGSFRRTVRLPKTVDAKSIRAEHKNGVLVVHLSRSESLIPKRIPVEVTTD